METPTILSIKDQKIVIISDEVSTWIQTVNKCILGMILSTFGVAANVINIAVFVKLGFTETINISLLALAVSDLLACVSFLWLAVGWLLPIVNVSIHWAVNEVTYITGGCLYSSFTKITSWLVVFITLERCLCVAIPLKVKQVLTTGVTVSVIAGIYITMAFCNFTEYVSLYLGWRFSLQSNTSIIGIIPRQNRSAFVGKSFILLTLFQSISFIAVVTFTVLLVVKMKQNLEWRKESNFRASRSLEMYRKRNDRTVKMVLGVAFLYIACYLPGILMSISGIIEPDLDILRRYRNVYLTFWSTAFVTEILNSCTSIFVYCSMSSKYKTAFNQLFAYK